MQRVSGSAGAGDVTKGMYVSEDAPEYGLFSDQGNFASPAAQEARQQVLVQTRPKPAEQAPQSELFKIAQARIKGFEGDPCPSCGSFTLVRNGTCMKCQTCGGTTGCS